MTFQLRAPDPEFLDKLTLLLVPTPPGTPVGRLSSPLPGTGPYQISAYDTDKVFALTRNPYFRQWSAAAQPAGFPDAITWVKTGNVQEAADAVLLGRADLAQLTPLFADPAETGPLVSSLYVAEPDRLHHSVVQGTSFGVLNSSIPPFDNRRPARRSTTRSTEEGRRADGWPWSPPRPASSSRRACRPTGPTAPTPEARPTATTRGPTWSGRAPSRALRAPSARKLTVTDLVDDYNPPFDAYFAHVLRKLGYHVSLRRLADTRHNEHFFYGPRSDIQVQSGGWIADYPLPSNFYAAPRLCPDPGQLPVRALQPRAGRAAAATRRMLPPSPDPHCEDGPRSTGT